MLTLPIISTCAATECSFNQDGCTAGAITMGGQGAAACESMAALDARATEGEPGRVGVCKRLECVHNEGLRCKAEAITVGASTADCLSYEAK